MGLASLTRKQWAIFICCCIRNLLCAAVYSLQAPFYPAEAEKKGVTPAEYGFVFSVYALTTFIVSPIIGVQMKNIGIKFGFNMGMIIQAVSCILFGCLAKIDNTQMFVIYSVVIRIFEAVGMAVVFVSAVTLVANSFPENVNVTVSILETLFSIGLIIGPAIGGILYELGGFELPFYAMGGGLIFISLVSTGVLATVGDITPPAREEKMKPAMLYKIPGAWLGVVTIIACSISVGYLQATLEPHIRVFGLRPSLVGLLFVISGAMIAISSPIAGWLCDNGVQPRFIMLFGTVFSGLAYALIGPFPYIPVEPTLALCIIGLILNGLGAGGLMMPSLIDPVKVAYENGLPNNSDTYSLVSSVWQAAYSIGSFIGPTMGGVLFEYLDFRRGSLVVIGMNVVLTLVLVSLLIKGGKPIREKPATIEASEDQDQQQLVSESGKRIRSYSRVSISYETPIAVRLDTTLDR